MYYALRSVQSFMNDHERVFFEFYKKTENGHTYIQCTHKRTAVALYSPCKKVREEIIISVSEAE